MMHCEETACAEASRLLKNARASATHKDLYARGLETPHGGWSRVARISPQELVLTEWFTGMGWEPQHRVNTGVHTNRLPRMFRLDFALPDARLYVEIDGTIHQKASRKVTDERRDAMMAALGWRGLRVRAREVAKDPDGAKARILDWVHGATS